MAYAYHMVHYRQINPVDDNLFKENFEAYCRSVLSEKDRDGVSLWNRISDRIYTDPEGMNQQIILNRVADLSSSVFGEMCLIDTNSLQAVLRQQTSSVTLSNLTVAEIYELQEREAPDGSQFIRGMAYWLTIGNHLFFVKTSSMSPRMIHKYFSWLLKGKQTGLPIDADFVLQAEFDKSQISGDIGDIRNLRVKGGTAPQFVANTVDHEPQRGISTSKKVADKYVQFKQAVPVLEALFGNERTKSLVESLGPEEYLSVDASVKIRGRRTEASKANLKELTNELADLTDGSILVEGKGGKISDGDAILRTSMRFNLLVEGASLLEFDNVADQLQEVYSRFVRDGMIVA